MPRFTPLDEKELRDLLPKGQYKGQVTNAEEKTSKSSGAPMLEIRIEIYDAVGKRHSVIDRIVFSDSMMWKLHGFCKSAGILNHYEAGEVTAFDCMDKNVHCNVIIKEQEGFEPKNEIKSYFVPKDAVASPAAKSTGTRPKPEPIVGEDNIPF